MDFEWDIYKAIANWFKHRISFGQIVTALEDPHALILEKIVAGETRYVLIGEMSVAVQPHPAKIVVVIYVIREKKTKRIISARSANVHERKEYEGRRRLGE